MKTHFARPLVTAFVLACAARAAAQIQVDAERIVKALDIRPGSIVAEIGAGDGELTLLIARVVGDTGKVYGNELSETRLKEIARAADAAGLRHVTPVAGREGDTGLPDSCCDAIFMRDVYHHFANPAAMNVSLLKSLKPGGRLGILDFTPPGAESPTPAHRGDDGQHGVRPPTVERELKAAGFEIVSSTEVAWRSFLVVARRTPDLKVGPTAPGAR